MKPRRVLVVDDEPTMRQTLALVFQAAGYRVQTAADADSARGASFDLALVDLHLGETDGLTLVEALFRHNTAPILVLSGSADPEDREAAVQAGAWGFLSKPISMASLNQILDYYLGAEPPDEAVRARFGLRPRDQPAP